LAEYSIFITSQIDLPKLDLADYNIIIISQIVVVFCVLAGYAFEAVCIKHIDQILKKLEIENLASGIGSWRYAPPKKSRETGAQIDLLIDRIDNSINICEIKFSIDKYSIDKADARNLDNKVKVFEEKTGTRKQIFLTMITTLGLKKNFYSEELVDSEVELIDLIK